MGRSAAMTAREVSEALLDHTGRAIQSHDFDDFIAAFALPHTHVTLQGAKLLESEDDLRVIFDALRQRWAEKGITRMVRSCVAAEFRNETTVIAIHETQLFAGATLAGEPYHVRSELVLDQGRWLIAASNYSVHWDRGHAAALMPDRFPSDLGKGSRSLN